MIISFIAVFFYVTYHLLPSLFLILHMFYREFPGVNDKKGKEAKSMVKLDLCFILGVILNNTEI